MDIFTLSVQCLTLCFVVRPLMFVAYSQRKFDVLLKCRMYSSDIGVSRRQEAYGGQSAPVLTNNAVLM